MKTPPIFLAVLLLLVTTALAVPLDMCGSQKEILQNCTMLTPSLSGCNPYNYTMYNITDGSKAQNGTLTLMAVDIYEFNVTVGAGDYIIQLCDKSTREVRVKTEEDGSMLGGALILIAIIGLFGFGVHYFRQGEHEEFSTFKTGMRMLFFMMMMFFTIIAIDYGRTILENTGGSAAMLGVLNIAYSTLIIITGFTFTIMLVALIYGYMKQMNEIKLKEQERREVEY